SQMNPHFIFNSLNSIQDLVLREETENSYDYIVLFAKLVRNTLNHSNQDFIPIEKELEFLDVYLTLEQLRFAKDFKYSVEFNGTKDIDVPSLLIQPFIENALVHGLLHKKGLKKLEIKFVLTDKLTCTIIDNGVGRKRAKDILNRQRGGHESFAMMAIEQRFKLLNKQLGAEIGTYEITDLYNGEEAVGTSVVLTIPFRQHY
ncbi:MAG: sensor histidine kinase, partial [Crocinitomicaceae bacterium]|nr:sensor histidine kinase [Crocinitomicaceae bacterium]